MLLVSLALAACAAGPDFKPPVNQSAALINAQSQERAPVTGAGSDR